MRRFPKKYGEYKTDWCPYCGRKALFRNSLGLNVCKEHKDEKTEPALKTQTGEWLEVKPGKFGNYCISLRRGNISLKNAFELCGRQVDE